MQIAHFRMDEATARFWSTLFGGITAVGLVAGGLYTVVEYRHSKETERIAHEQDLTSNRLSLQTAGMAVRAPFYSKRVDLCVEAADAAATIAITSDAQNRAKAYAEFSRLYWGSLDRTDLLYQVMG